MPNCGSLADNVPNEKREMSTRRTGLFQDVGFVSQFSFGVPWTSTFPSVRSLTSCAKYRPLWSPDGPGVGCRHNGGSPGV
jgi:hypothetical protein